jgi:hypothetical protein
MSDLNLRRSTLRQKHFRKFLFSEDELMARGSELRAQIGKVYELWRSQTSSEAEVVATYIKSFLTVFRPRDYRGGPHGELLTKNLEALSPVIREFATTSFRSVPLAVNRALVCWAEGLSQLEILDHVPDPLSVLRRQSRGQRIVTCIFESEKLTKFVEDSRDPLGFVLHDLIHADHFFRFSDWYEGQKEFYKKTLERLERGEFSEKLLDEKNARRFEYVISDMNSHPAHLEQMLERI